MRERAIVEFWNKDKNKTTEIEVPLEITSNDLIFALNDAFELGMDMNNLQKCYLAAENPIAFVHGNKTLGDLGIRNGSVIIYTRG